MTIADWMAIMEVTAAVLERSDEGPKSCHCETCTPNLFSQRFIVCPKCGNKRCPHATDCRNECSGSNAPGQVGSSYGEAA